MSIEGLIIYFRNRLLTPFSSRDILLLILRLSASWWIDQDKLEDLLKYVRSNSTAGGHSKTNCKRVH
jgi:hypothetical protein